jgi:hypothetical protein
MGKKSSPKPPPAPDPAATAAAQGAANREAVRESALVNQINEVTPYGSLTYTGEIGGPDRTRTTSLTPEGQAQLDQRNQLATMLGGYALDRAGQIDNDPFSLAGQPPLPTDFSADAQAVEQASFDRAMGLMNPQFDREEDRMKQELANRGIPIGQEAYTDVYDQFSTRKDNARLAAAMDAVAAGRAEQSRMYGLTSDARRQGINEQLLERSQPINELAALLQGAPATGSPNFAPQAQYQVASPDVIGATQLGYQGQLNAFNAQQANRQAGLGGLFQLGSAAIGAFPF